jgi:methylenetetrahydrofolate dehydrogenase (NADP+)/methenyltetrahydrofolate cyclohydrolase/formyltetrahydrofolate synthetase
LISAQRSFERSRNRTIQPLPLNLLEPVPSDIEIASAQQPKNVQDICVELGLSGSEVSAHTSKSSANLDSSQSAANHFSSMNCTVNQKPKLA